MLVFVDALDNVLQCIPVGKGDVELLCCSEQQLAPSQVRWCVSQCNSVTVGYTAF